MTHQGATNIIASVVAGLRERIRNSLVRIRPASWIIEQASPGSDSHLVELFTETGIAFIHIPKTGGTSVSAMLYNYDVKHRTWKDIYDLAPDNFENWLKIAVVRDPVDRFVSAFDYLSRGGRNRFDAEVGRRFVAPCADVNSFANKMLDPAFNCPLLKYFHFRPQSDYVLSGDNLCMVDRLVPFEHLMIELPILLNKNDLALPVMNVTQGIRTARSSLSNDTVSIIRQLYALDFVLHRISLSGSREHFREQVIG